MCTYSSLKGLSSRIHKIWKMVKAGQKLYNWLRLTAGWTCYDILLTIVGPRCDKTCLRGFRQSETQTSLIVDT